MLDDARWTVAHRVSDLAARTPGRSGNLSLRSGDVVAITPSGVPYPDLEPADVPVIDLDGDRVEGTLAPSSETPLHTAIYRRFDVGAVVHAHPPWATTLAACRRPVPAVHYGLARAGGRVPVAAYAPYGSEELAENAVESMASAGTTACLLANHGLVATGAELDAAFDTFDAVEFTARIYGQAASLEAPTELSTDEIDRAASQFDSYGQP